METTRLSDLRFFNECIDTEIPALLTCRISRGTDRSLKRSAGLPRM